LKNLAHNHQYQADILVIGAGIAGQAVASQILDGPELSLIVDAGPEFSHRSKVRIAPSSLRIAAATKFRRFGIGGTSSIWGGNLLPFTNSELATFLDQGEIEEVQREIKPGLRFLGVKKAEAYFSKNWHSEYLNATNSDLKVQVLARPAAGAPHIIPDSKTPSPHQKYIEGLWCLEIRKGSQGGYIGIFESSGGSKLTIQAQKIVLASGGLESMRLLNASPDLGIDLGLLGKKFSTHLTGIVGTVSSSGESLLKSNAVEDSVAQEFHHVSFASEKGRSAWKITYLPLRNSLLEIPGLGRESLRVLLLFLLDKLTGKSTYLINVDGDQQPNMNSEVLFRNKGDLTIKATYNERDVESYDSMKAALKSEIGSEAQLRFFSNPFRTFIGKSHHLGGTPIGASHAEGLVSSNLELFGNPDFYVCASSVFPTFSAANPTLFLVQLALRLGKKIRGLS
jgi:hypothetical protein